jgi:hypothetical protein
MVLSDKANEWRFLQKGLKQEKTRKIYRLRLHIAT